MNLDRAVMAFAGVMILASVLLVHFVSPWWLLVDRVHRPCQPVAGQRSPACARRR